MKIPFLNLKLERLAELRAVLAREHGRRSWFSIAKSIVQSVRHNRTTTPRPIWRARIRACHACPIFCPILRRCRPNDTSDLGCGCYVPFLALTPQPYERPGCWINQAIETQRGWASIPDVRTSGHHPKS